MKEHFDVMHITHFAVLRIVYRRFGFSAFFLLNYINFDESTIYDWLHGLYNYLKKKWFTQINHFYTSSISFIKRASLSVGFCFLIIFNLFDDKSVDISIQIHPNVQLAIDYDYWMETLKRLNVS